MNDIIVKPPSDESEVVEKCWAALRGDRVISTISMRVPADVDFDLYREKSLELLSMLGDVKTGSIILKDDGRYFLARPHKHQNRNKNKPKKPIIPVKIQ